MKGGQAFWSDAGRAWTLAWVLGVSLCGPATWAEAKSAVTPRFGVHETYDRVVIDLPPGSAVSGHQSGADFTVQSAGIGQVAQPGKTGRRMLGLDGGDGALSIHMAPGTHAKMFRVGDRLVIDVVDGKASSQVADQSPGIAAAPAKSAVGPWHVRHLAAHRLTPSPAPTPPMATAPAPILPAKAEPLPAPVAPATSAAAPPPPAAAPPVAAPPAAAASAAADPGPSPGAPSSPGIAGSAGPPSAGGQTDAASMAAGSQRAYVTLLGEDADLGGPAILVPYGPESGMAAFRRGGAAHVVFDVAHPLDLSALKDDPVFGDVTERLLPDGMHLRMRLAPDSQIRVVRRPGGWALAVVHVQPTLKAIASHADKGVLSIAASSPGHALVLNDDLTGGKLLVGTQKADGEYVAAVHRDAEFIMEPTWRGVVVEPVSDRLSLQPVRDGFILRAADGPGLALVWPDAPSDAGAAARTMTRRFDLPDLPWSDLQNRLTLAVRDAALTPKLGRFAARMRVAQAMLAQGLDVEARGVIHAAISDDPAHADDPDAAGMSAIASWLQARAGGPDAVPGNGFDPAVLGASDEARMWQALLTAGQADVSEQAASLAATWPLLLQYPPDLRRRLIPEVGRVLGAGGQDKALAAYLAAFPNPSLDFVRAGLLQRQGKLDESLALLDAVARRPDRLMRALALRNAVEARLAAKRIDATAAAAALGRQLYAWRGGETDLALRLRVAHLRVQAGLWRQALALLRETDDLYPEAHARLHEAETKLITDLVHGDTAAKLSALDLVALADEASNLLSASDADTTLAPVLVDKLLALDLPGRAEPILQKLYDRATDPAQKAELGVRLAGLCADRGDSKGALSVLAASDDDGLEPALVGRRGMLRASLLAKTGQTGDALGVLSAMPDEPAVELHAGILEQSRNYPDAVKLLGSFVSSPALAKIPDQTQRNLILRLANDESEVGDMAALRRLRDSEASHFTSGPDAELFAVLTQEPIKATSDLPRAAKELAGVRALPASLARR